MTNTTGAASIQSPQYDAVRLADVAGREDGDGKLTTRLNPYPAAERHPIRRSPDTRTSQILITKRPCAQPLTSAGMGA